MTIDAQEDLYHVKNNQDLLIMLPFAGGNSNSYKNIIKFLPPSWTILCPKLPGRRKLSGMPLCENLEEMVEIIFRDWILPLDFHGRYMVYGHSMGAMLGLLLVHKICTSGMWPPQKLIVSGRGGEFYDQGKEWYHQLPREAFRTKLKELGGMQEEILEDSGMMEYLEPILRSDFKAVETYRHVPKEVLDIPILALYGSEEKLSQQAVEAWQNESKNRLDVRCVQGGHFFILKRPSEIAEYLYSALPAIDII
jgi:surfactin synthase thioesterase subunit